AQDGIATFTSLAIGGDAGERTLRFTATGLEPAVSETFALAPGPRAALHIQVEPGGAEIGAPLSPQPVIHMRDAYGNVTEDDDTTVVTAVIASGGGSIAGGGTTTVANGVATFTDLAIDGAAGERTLRFAAQGLTPAESEPFSLTAAAPASLRIRVQPGGATAGVRLATQPVIEIRDANGDVANDDDATVVTATIASGGGSIVGGATVTAQNGIATFANLAIGGDTGQRTLRFAATGLEPAVSEAFALAPGPAATLSLHNGDGQNGRADTDLPVPLAVLVHDGFGNGVPDVAVDWTVTAGDGTVRSDDGQTNEDGVTSAVYRLGPHAGVDTIEASAAGLDGSPVSFTATSTPNARISGTVTRVAGSASAGVLAQLNGSAGPGGRTAAAGFAMVSATSSGGRGRLLALAGAGGDVAAASGPPPQPLPTAQRPEFVADELIVTFRAQPLGAPPIGANAYRAPAAAAVVMTSMRRVLEPHEQTSGTAVVGVSPAILTARLRVDPRTIASTEQALRADPAIERVERNAIVYSSAIPLGTSVPRLPPLATVTSVPRVPSLATVTPNDAFYAWQAWHYHMIDLPRAWEITTGRASVVVAVLDDGIRFDHPDIALNLTNDGYDFVSDGSVMLCSGGTTPKAGDGDGYDPYPETPVRHRWADTCAGDIESNGGHGLHVAGIIGASSNNGGGVAGVNWNVSIRPVRVLDITGRGTHYDVAQGLLYAAGLPADDGAGGAVAAPSVARIINLSFAGPQSSMLLEDAVGAAANAGALIVAAAGNAATSTPNYPAAYPQTVSVSAVQPDGSLASYSSFGPTIDIAAPGGETSLGCDFGVWSTTWNFVRNLRSFSCWAGTSMAAPHVTGVAALLLAAQPGLNAAQLRARILGYAVPAGDPTRFGAGIVNARNSLTLSHAPARSLHVRLIDADNGANVADAMAAPNGSYTFGELDDGNYYVYAGEDEGGDGVIGVPVRRWGAAGGSAAPTVIAVDGAGEYPVSFEIGVPLALATPPPDPGANVLPIGGYLTGGPAAQGVHDFVLEVPAPGSYIFETSAVSGACGFALEADTRLRLYNEAFGLIASNDDIDPAAGNLCARITQTLQPGTYHLEVLDVSGRYAVSARRRP
ncbi:MAG: S8 family serine peptidase, partial [Longimicrobiales bacterium]